MPEPISATAAGAMFGQAAVKAFVEDVYKSVSQQLKKEIEKWRTASGLKRIRQQLWNVRLVKTIWQIDKAVDLFSFYYPAEIEIGKKRLKVAAVAELPVLPRVVIQGTAGQGKSIFLRFLAANQMQFPNLLPVFVELRHLNGGTVAAAIRTAINYLGLSASEEMVEYLLRTNRVCLMLDAFDEIDENQQGLVVAELEGMSTKYPNLHIIVTSRPEAAVCHARSFAIVRLAPLRQIDVEPIIDKLVDDTPLRNLITKAIKKSRTDIMSVLTTPLMVTLLIFAYKATSQIPETQPEFYDGLLDVLLSRHDKAKPGYVRKRQCGKSDKEFRLLFEAVAFASRTVKWTAFSKSQYEELVEQAAKATRVVVNENDYIDDIKKITGLVVEDGRTYQFIHKTIQEYYAAAYIKRRCDEEAQPWYALLASGKWSQWQRECEFLRDIDSYRYFKFFLLPHFEERLEAHKVAGGPCDINRTIDKIIAEDLMVEIEGKELRHVMMPRKGVWMVPELVRRTAGRVFGSFGSVQMTAIEKGVVAGVPGTVLADSKEYSLADLMRANVECKAARELVEEVREALLAEYKWGKAVVAAEAEAGELLRREPVI